MTKANTYPKHTISEHIVPFDLVFKLKDTAKSVIKKIEKYPLSWSNIEHLFIVDEKNKLLGAVEFSKLIKSPPETTLDNLATEKFTFVTKHAHQSNIAKIALKTGVENIPVVDEDMHFVGIIDASQILKILQEEHVEKLMHFSGILENKALVSGYKAKAFSIARSRFPWLLVGLLGGIAATFVVEGFSHTLEQELALAFFIPVIVYMNDAVGTQTETVFVRFSTLEKISLIKSLVNEAKVSLLLGVSLSGLLFAFNFLWLGARISIIVALAMFLGIMSSSIIGTIIPWLLEKFDKDPAIGSGPFTTILQDLLSIAIYFSIASFLL